MWGKDERGQEKGRKEAGRREDKGMEEGKDDDSSDKMTLHCQNWGAGLHALDKVSIINCYGNQ